MEGDIQNWWEVPCIAHFCSLFRVAFELLDFDIEDLEEALLTDGVDTEADGSTPLVLRDLLVRLLQGILGKKNVSSKNYLTPVRQLCSKKWHEVKKDVKNPFLEESNFHNLSLKEKVQVLHALCDIRLDAEDVPEVLKNLEADSLRVEPLGQDEQGSMYWYFYGTRLYKEDLSPKQEVFLEKQKEEKKGKKERKGKTGDKKDMKPGPLWNVVCFTQEDWENLAGDLENSSSKGERALYRTLKEDFLPEIPRLFDEKDRLQRKRIQELMPRRTSTRLRSTEEKRQKQDETQNDYTSSLKKKAIPRKRSKESKSPDEISINSCDSFQNNQNIPLPSDEDNDSWAKEDKEELEEKKVEKKQLDPSPLKAKGKKKIKSSHLFNQSTEDLRVGMFKVLDYLENLEDSWPFLEPVQEEYAPNYYKRISKPMDLQTMEEKLEQGGYLSYDEFEADFHLIISNCRKYNGATSEYSEMADELQRNFEKAVKKYLEVTSSSDEDIVIENFDEPQSHKTQQSGTKAKTKKKKKKKSIVEEEKENVEKNSKEKKRKKKEKDEGLGKKDGKKKKRARKEERGENDVGNDSEEEMEKGGVEKKKGKKRKYEDDIEDEIHPHKKASKRRKRETDEDEESEEEVKKTRSSTGNLRQARQHPSNPSSGEDSDRDRKTKKKEKKKRKDSVEEEQEQKPKPKKPGYIKNKKAIDALAAATEETLKDINKWLEDTPRLSSGFSSGEEDSPIHKVSAEEFDEIAEQIEKEYRRKLKGRSGSGKQRHLSHSSDSDADYRSSSTKRTSRSSKSEDSSEKQSKDILLKKLKTRLKFNDPKLDSLISKVKELRQLRAMDPAERNAKLSMGSVLHTDFARKHVLGQITSPQGEKPKETKVEVKEVLVKEEVKAKVESQEEKKETPPPDEKKSGWVNKATPNLSAWFKAFGAPKTKPPPVARVKPTTPVKSAAPWSYSRLERENERRRQAAENAQPTPHPPPPSSNPAGSRQRNLSTASSNASDAAPRSPISERSPAYASSESEKSPQTPQFGVWNTEQSPSNTTERSPVPAQERAYGNERSPKVPLPKVGFYQDATQSQKTSPAESGSIHSPKTPQETLAAISSRGYDHYSPQNHPVSPSAPNIPGPAYTTYQSSATKPLPNYHQSISSSSHVVIKPTPQQNPEAALPGNLASLSDIVSRLPVESQLDESQQIKSIPISQPTPSYPQYVELGKTKTKAHQQVQQPNQATVAPFFQSMNPAAAPSARTPTAQSSLEQMMRLSGSPFSLQQLSGLTTPADKNQQESLLFNTFLSSAASSDNTTSSSGNALGMPYHPVSETFRSPAVAAVYQQPNPQTSFPSPFAAQMGFSSTSQHPFMNRQSTFPLVDPSPTIYQQYLQQRQQEELLALRGGSAHPPPPHPSMMIQQPFMPTTFPPGFNPAAAAMHGFSQHFRGVPRPGWL